MIVVRVELHSAITGRVTTLGTAHLANDVTGTPDLGNYEVAFYKRGVTNPRVRQTAGLWRAGKVTGFPRKRLLAWDLLYRALGEVVGDRNRPVGGPEKLEEAAALRVEVERLRGLRDGVLAMAQGLAGVRQRSPEVNVLLRALENLAEGDDPRATPGTA